MVALSPIAIPSAHAKDLTRDEVKAELAELRALGYRSSTEDPHYPKHLQEIMAKLHEKHMKERTEAGAIPVQSPIDDRTVAAPEANRTADQDKCVGPISFCNPHFGS
ncbi:hypothetical protein WT27_02150 [Burkholderia territorii]|uniref:DUF4148 domain-containing protein n=2 Tax=Burkholderia territorii TaxID=1503055 RepID=A0A105VUR5_9BURK|nr:hypothetical protein WT27_02150 [Burkholderia territorii]KVX39111.1 hypothetical protein WT31_03025 [Burkholderia territorii]